jgi:hypothetical protein
LERRYNYTFQGATTCQKSIGKMGRTGAAAMELGLINALVLELAHT